MGFQPWIELKSFPERITLFQGLFELNLDFSVKASSTKLLQTTPKEREWLKFNTRWQHSQLEPHFMLKGENPQKCGLEMTTT